MDSASIASIWHRRSTQSSIVTLQSGQRFTPVLQLDNSNIGKYHQQAGSDRQNPIGNPTLPNPSASLWFKDRGPAAALFLSSSANRNILQAQV